MNNVQGEAPAIEFTNVSLSIGGNTILNGANFSIHSNRFIALLGPNGAGKTTLIRSILGLVTPTSGVIRVDGRQCRAGRHDIGYMPQLKNLNASGLPAHAFVASAFGGERWGFMTRRRNHEVDRVLDLVDALAIAQRPIGALSGGERQRLLLAQALLGRPKLLLLDEPLASLDPARIADVIDLIARLQHEMHLTVLLCAHDINPLLGATTDVLYLARGNARFGPVDDIITPQTLSAIYDTPIDVIRAQNKIFVMTAGGTAIGGHCSGHTHAPPEGAA